MNILNYIRGKRRGKEANRLEKEAMSDPFLYEALEGYDQFDEEVADDIDFLQKEILKKSQKRHHYFIVNPKRLAIAASYSVLVIGIFMLLFFSERNNQQGTFYALNEKKETTIDQKEEDFSQKNALKTEEKINFEEPLKEIRNENNTREEVTGNTTLSLLSPELEMTVPDDEITISANAVPKEIAEEDQSFLTFAWYSNGTPLPSEVDSAPQLHMEKQTSLHAVDKALASAAGVASQDGNIMSVRGNRSDGQIVLIDGVRARSGVVTTPTDKMLPSLFPYKSVDSQLQARIVSQINRTTCPDLHGRIEVRFSVTPHGNIIDMTISESNCYELKNEILKVLKEIGGWEQYNGIILLYLDF